MVTKDFTLSVDDANTVRRFLSRIKSIFKEVEIKFEGSDTSSRTNIEWVCLVGPTETVCEKTKNYITSLTTPSNKVIIKIPSWLESELSCNDSKLLKELERQSGAVIGIDSKCSQINIQGVDELTVVVAKSLVDEKLEAKQKSSENLTTGNDSIRIERQSSITEVCDGVKQFALKLGYDDNDIMDAAKKCSRNGNNVNENALLQELLKSNPHKLKEGLAQEDDNFFRDIARTVGEITSAQTTTTMSSSQSCETKRDIVIDGSNVAMCHGHKEVFSCTGIDIVVQWFRQRGHRNIVVFVPQWRQEASKADSPISNQDILTRLNKEKILVFTPSRRINGRRVVCYDDRYIVKYAFETDSVIVSNDNFRDLYKETPEWKPFLEQRLLMYSFVNDKFMPPDDPNGRWGPTLDEFLKMGSTIRNCPYKNKCTYGSKCRFYHPEKEMSSLNSDAGGPVLSEKNQPKFHSQPILQTSCAIENKMYDRSTPYQQEIIARGRTSVSDIVERGSEVYNPAPDWNSNQVNPTYSNSLYYQPSPTYRSQQPSVPGYYMSGHSSYTLPPRQQPSYHHIRQQTSYSVQENLYPTQTAHQQQSHRVQENSYLNQHTLYPSHQQSNFSVRQNQPPCHSYSTPRSHSQQFSVMPGYVDPRMLNHYYRTPSNMSVMHPVVIPVETALVQEAVGNREYLLRCDRYDSKNEVRFQKLLEMFPTKQQAIGKVLQEYPNEPNLNVLASFVVDY